MYKDDIKECHTRRIGCGLGKSNNDGWYSYRPKGYVNDEICIQYTDMDVKLTYKTNIKNAILETT